MREFCTVLSFLFTEEPNSIHFCLPVFSLSKDIDYTGAPFGNTWEHCRKEKTGRWC